MGLKSFSGAVWTCGAKKGSSDEHVQGEAGLVAALLAGEAPWTLVEG